MFKLDPGLMIWTVVSFFIFLGLLTKLAYNPLLAVLKKREESIQSALDESQKAKKDAGKLVLEHRKQLDDVKLEVRKLIDEGKASGEEVKKDVVSRAQHEAEQLLTRARGEINSEKDKALEELQGQVADLAIKVASKVISKVLSKDDHITVLTESISEVKSSK